MDKLARDFRNSLIVNSVETIKDYIEIGIDSFIEEGVLKELPIVSTIAGGLKIAKNVYDRNLLKQTLYFISELNDGSVSADKLNKYREIIQNNDKKCEEELGRVLIYLNGFVDKEKSVFLSRLYKAYIANEINWNEFCEFAEVVNRMFIQDIETLKTIYKEEINLGLIKEDEFRAERLYSIGLIGISYKPLTVGNLKDGKINTGRIISPLGKRFCEIILNIE